MKVCPNCERLNEEKNQIKCSGCGYDLSNELDYNDNEIDERYKQIAKQKKQKKKFNTLINGLIVVSLIIGLFVGIPKLTKGPLGHVDVQETLLEMKLDEVYKVNITMSDGIKYKHIIVRPTNVDQIDVVFVNITDTGIYVKAQTEGTVTLEFVCNQDEFQENYNNKILVNVRSINE